MSEQVENSANDRSGDGPVVIYATFPTEALAETIGSTLVEHGIVACVNILGGMTSIYMWGGKRCQDREVAMLIKTRRSLTEAVVSEIRQQHPYENPAIIEIPIAGGSAPFLSWLLETTAARRGISERGPPASWQ